VYREERGQERGKAEEGREGKRRRREGGEEKGNGGDGTPVCIFKFSFE